MQEKCNSGVPDSEVRVASANFVVPFGREGKLQRWAVMFKQYPQPRLFACFRDPLSSLLSLYLTPLFRTEGIPSDPQIPTRKLSIRSAPRAAIGPPTGTQFSQGRPNAPSFSVIAHCPGCTLGLWNSCLQASCSRLLFEFHDLKQFRKCFYFVACLAWRSGHGCKV